MKTVLLLRHAKSSWDAAVPRDKDRPLNARGRAAALMMGAYIAANRLTPDIIYCSTAARTRETLARMEATLKPAPAVVLRDGLYLASAERLLEEINNADDADATLMIIAHNPGLEDLALAFTDPRTSDRAAIRRLQEKFPTAALAEFAFDVSRWQDVAQHTGALKRFQRPRDLVDG